MTEIYDAENIVKDVYHSVVGCKVVDVVVTHNIFRLDIIFDDCHRRLEGSTITDVFRRGKAIVFEFQNDRFQKTYMVSRLGMNARWNVHCSDIFSTEKISSWPLCFIIEYQNSRIFLYHTDPKKTGKIEVVERLNDAASLSNYGPEILSSQFSLDWVKFACSRRQLPVKSLLLEQCYFAGVGNILASEICFLANLHPSLKSNKQLSGEDVKRLFYAIHLTVCSSLHEDYQVNVYGREGQDCYTCGCKIEKIKIAKRGTYFCPHCQSMMWQPKSDVCSELVKKIAKGKLHEINTVYMV